MKIKICCIKSLYEAQLAIKYGATAIGLVSDMPSGPGILSENEIIRLRQNLNSSIDIFLLSSKGSIDEISKQLQLIRPTHLQLVDYIEVAIVNEIKKRFNHIKIVQVIHVTDESIFDLAKRYMPIIDYFLLDSGTPFSNDKTLGGTGNTHNWNLSSEFVINSIKPVYLAGGINSSNVNKAISTVNPYGIDLCSGVRTNDILDEFKVKAFFESIH